MHNNIWATLLLTSVPAGLILLIGFLQWLKKRKFPKKTILLAVIFAFMPLTFVIGHILSKKKEMSKREGVYSVVHYDKTEELCKIPNVENLQLVLLKSGKYSFNVKPCFANKKEGKWKWQDDMVGTYAVFDIEINNNAYLRFDDKDTLRLIKEGRNYLTFAKQQLQK